MNVNYGEVSLINKLNKKLKLNKMTLTQQYYIVVSTDWAIVPSLLVRSKSLDYYVYDIISNSRSVKEKHRLVLHNQ